MRISGGLYYRGNELYAIKSMTAWSLLNQSSRYNTTREKPARGRQLRNCAVWLIFTQCISIAAFSWADTRPSDGSISSLQKEAAEADGELKKLLKALSKAQKKLDAQQQLKSKAAREFKQTELDLGEVSKQLLSTKRSKKRLEGELIRLKAEQATLEKHTESQRQQTAEAIRAAYLATRNNPIVDILSQKNPANANRDQVYLDYVTRARMEKIAAYQAMIEQQRELTAQIHADSVALEQALLALEEQQQQLKSLQQKRKQLIAEMSREIEQDQQRISALEADREALQQLIEGIQDVVERDESQAALQQYSQQWGDFTQAKGQLPWPVSGKRSKQFSGAGQKSDVKWPGITIKANAGEPVRAIFPGTVVFSDWFKGLGLLLIIDHGGGYWSLYGRNQSVLSKPGTLVSAGETIATVGNSGGQGEPALYFEIRQNGQPSDPSHWCKS